MLKGTGKEPAAGNLDLLAVPILGDDPDLLAPRHVGVVAGQREAALEIVLVAARPDDPGIHQLVELVADLDDTGLQGDPHLRRGQPDTGCLPHRLGHVVEQLVEVGTEAVDGLALEAETGIAKKDDGSDAHGASIPTVAVSPGSGVPSRTRLRRPRPGHPWR